MHMINATLCSTSREEPWAANVDFEVHGTAWVVELHTKYTHYKNVVENSNVVIVYKTAGFEIIAKGTASVGEPTSDNIAVASISLNWLRLVENDTVTEYTDTAEIERVVVSHT